MTIKRINTNNIFNIVEDGIQASVFLGEGRMIPGVIINSPKNTTELINLISIHKESKTQGDVTTAWAYPLSGLLRRKKIIYLDCNFTKPMVYQLQIKFVVDKHYSLIDGIVQSKGLHIGAGEKGNKFSSKSKKGELINIEVPDGGFEAKWNKILYSVVKKKSKKIGIPKKDLNRHIQTHISTMRELLNFKMDTKK